MGVDVRPRRGAGGTSGGSAARGPSARTIFGTGSGWPAPAARSRAVTDATKEGEASSVNSTSSSRNRAARRRPVDERHLVVDDLGELAPVPVAEHHDLALGVEVRDEPDRCRAREGAHEVERRLGRLAGFTVEVDLFACEAVVEPRPEA